MVQRSSVRYIHIAPAPGNVQPVSVANIVIAPAGLPTATLVAQKTLQLSATVTDFFGHSLATTDVLWSSANPSIASISATGLVTGQSIGTTQISASIGGVIARLILTVTQAQDGSIADLTTRLGPRFVDWWEPLSAYGGGTVSLAPIIGSRALSVVGAPAFDAVNERLTTNGSSSYLTTGEQAAYDPSTGPKTLVFMSTLNLSGFGYLGGLQKHDFTHSAFINNQGGKVGLQFELTTVVTTVSPTSAIRLTLVTLVNAVGQVLSPLDTSGTLANPFRSLEVVGAARRLWNTLNTTALPAGNYEFIFGGVWNSFLVGSGETLSGMGIMTGYPSAVDIATLVRRLIARGGAVMTGQAPLFSGIGDSRTAGTLNSAGMSWPAQYQALVGSSKVVDNRGAPGRTLKEMSLLRDIMIAGDVSPYRTGDTFGILGGVNDGGAGADVMEQEYFTFGDAVRAAGGKALFIPEISNTALRATMNPVLRSSLGTHCDLVANTDTDTPLQTGDVSFYNGGDPVHPNDAGQGRIAADVFAVTG